MTTQPESDQRQALSSEADRASETATRNVSDAGPTPEQDRADKTPPHGDPAAPRTAAEQGAAQAESDAAEEEDATAAEDHESKVKRDLDELSAKAEKADEYLELAQRTKADFENYRKRAVREAALAQERGIVKLAKELLPAVDNLDRALENAEQNGADPLADGIKLVHAEVVAALSRAGIERFSPEGEQFDPQHHEAVAQQPIDGAEPGTIVEVYQRGYRIGESILRPARVLVAA
jgi:molecular chaperone GrpE